MSKLFIFFIVCYQRFLSPVMTALGASCRFSSDLFGIFRQAFERFAWWKAIYLTGARLLKCGPWHAGGVDLVVSKK